MAQESTANDITQLESTIAERDATFETEQSAMYEHIAAIEAKDQMYAQLTSKFVANIPAVKQKLKSLAVEVDVLLTQLEKTVPKRIVQ